MAEEFDDMDNLDFDLEENEDGIENDLGSDGAVAVTSSSGGSGSADIYTAMLIISAAFYLIALVATMAEMAPYCTDFLGGLF